MDAEKARFPVRFMASRLGVSTSGFYEWRQRQQSPCQRRIVDAGLSVTITPRSGGSPAGPAGRLAFMPSCGSGLGYG